VPPQGALGFFWHSVMGRESHQTIDFPSLARIRDHREFLRRARSAEKLIISGTDPLPAYRLSLEFASRNITARHLETFIISTGDPSSIFKLARDNPRVRVERLQAAMLQIASPAAIARFACLVPGADKRRLEKLIIKSGNAQAAAFFITHDRFCNLAKLKPIIMRSGKPRYLLALAKRLTSKKDILRIQELIIQSGSYRYMRLFAAACTHADVQRLEDLAFQSMDIELIKAFALSVGSERASRLLTIC